MRQRGFSLIEITVVATIMLVVIGTVAPSYRVAMEQTNVDRCAAMLRSIWHAQRMHWLEMRTYAKTLQELVDARTLDAAVAGATEPFTFSMDSASDKKFDAEAVRTGSDWSGTLTIDETGAIAGHVQDPGGKRVDPAAK